MRNATLIVLAGLPGTGKSTLAQALAQSLGAIWLRIDSIEQGFGASGLAVGEGGYRAAYAIAADNLRLSHTVVADSVNPWMATRDAWRDVGLRSGARVLEAEIVCSNAELHRHRVETRTADYPRSVLPTWADVTTRDYRGWTRERLIVDTAEEPIATCLERMLAALRT